MDSLSVDESQDDNMYEKHVSCDTIRKKITLFLASKEMTQTAFLTAIGNVNSNSFGRFMKLKGKFGGIDNSTYSEARKFFARREKEKKATMKGAKDQKKLSGKPMKVDDTATSTKRTATSDLAANKPKAKIAKVSVASVEPSTSTVVELPADLPVYDDCDEVRTKIGQCFHKKEMTQSGFAKAIGLTPAARSKFLSKKGYNQGAGSDVYYQAYRYFEKQRLERREPKTNHRIKSEKNHPQGYELRNPRTHVWVLKGTRM